MTDVVIRNFFVLCVAWYFSTSFTDLVIIYAAEVFVLCIFFFIHSIYLQHPPFVIEGYPFTHMTHPVLLGEKFALTIPVVLFTVLPLSMTVMHVGVPELYALFINNPFSYVLLLVSLAVGPTITLLRSRRNVFWLDTRHEQHMWGLILKCCGLVYIFMIINLSDLTTIAAPFAALLYFFIATFIESFFYHRRQKNVLRERI